MSYTNPPSPAPPFLGIIPIGRPRSTFSRTFRAELLKQ